MEEISSVPTTHQFASVPAPEVSDGTRHATRDGEPEALAKRVWTGGCLVWPLPPDPSCASVIRSRLRAVMGGLRLPEPLTYDAATIGSELGSNVWRHALGGRTPVPPPAAGLPELWVYLRGAGPELVVKVFDSTPWLGTPGPQTRRPTAVAENGRGLEVMAALVAEHGGSWEVHRTRSRLGAKPVPGKAVTFALPFPHDRSGPTRRPAPTAAEGARLLRTELAARGIGPLYGSDGWEIALVNVSTDLTIWIRDGYFIVPTAGRHPLIDAVEAAEQIVRATS
jgi:hypothetical protein